MLLDHTLGPRARLAGAAASFPLQMHPAPRTSLHPARSPLADLPSSCSTHPTPTRPPAHPRAAPYLPYSEPHDKSCSTSPPAPAATPAGTRQALGRGRAGARADCSRDVGKLGCCRDREVVRWALTKPRAAVAGGAPEGAHAMSAQPCPCLSLPLPQGGHKARIKRHSSKNRCACCPHTEVGCAWAWAWAHTRACVVWLQQQLWQMGETAPSLRALHS